MPRALPWARSWRTADRAGRLAADPGARSRLLPAVACVVEVLRVQPGIGSRQLRAAVRVLRGFASDADTDAALKVLGAGVVVRVGARGDRHYTLDLLRAPVHVRTYLASRASGVPVGSSGTR